jgi:hypothetical protein
MKIDVWQQFYRGHEGGYQVFELTMKATKHIKVEIFKRDWLASSSQFIK